MIGVSTLALLFVPIFYVWFEGWAERRGAKSAVKLAAKLAERNIPITDKLRLAILKGPGTVYDPKADVKVSPDGTLTITTPPDFNPEATEDQKVGIESLTDKQREDNVHAEDAVSDEEAQRALKRKDNKIAEKLEQANEQSAKGWMLKTTAKKEENNEKKIPDFGGGRVVRSVSLLLRGRSRL